jgi:hypothetical protein
LRQVLLLLWNMGVGQNFTRAVSFFLKLKSYEETLCDKHSSPFLCILDTTTNPSVSTTETDKKQLDLTPLPPARHCTQRPGRRLCQ